MMRMIIMISRKIMTPSAIAPQTTMLSLHTPTDPPASTSFSTIVWNKKFYKLGNLLSLAASSLHRQAHRHRISEQLKTEEWVNLYQSKLSELLFHHLFFRRSKHSIKKHSWLSTKTKVVHNGISPGIANAQFTGSSNENASQYVITPSRLQSQPSLG